MPASNKPFPQMQWHTMMCSDISIIMRSRLHISVGHWPHNPHHGAMPNGGLHRNSNWKLVFYIASGWAGVGVFNHTPCWMCTNVLLLTPRFVDHCTGAMLEWVRELLRNVALCGAPIPPRPHIQCTVVVAKHQDQRDDSRHSIRLCKANAVALGRHDWLVS